MKVVHLVVAAVVAWSSTSVSAQVKVETPWVRGTVAQQKATGAFMRLTSEKKARLVAASSPVAGVTEIHEMTMDQDVMKMRQIPGLELVAGKATDLKPGGYHIMLMDLKQQVKAGDSVPITLVFENEAQQRFTQEIQVPAKALNPMPMPHGHGGMKH